MAHIDVFKGESFSMASMLKAIENVDHKPQLLGSLGLFEDNPVDTRSVQIESRDDTLSIIPTTPIGAPLPQRSHDKRTLRDFRTVRLAKGSTLQAEQIQGIRAFGSTTELEQAQTKVARILQQLTNDMETTWERHRLGAIQGVLLDADDSEIYDFYDEFGVSQPAVVDFNFGTLQAGQVRPLIEGSIVRPMIRASKGAMVAGSRIQALVGDDFWDGLVNHAEVRQTYLNWTAAEDLRKGTAFSSFSYAGVDWFNYRGTDDNSTVAIATDEAKFFPVGANGLFEVAWGPAEFFERVNLPGVPLLPMVIPDEKRGAFVEIELYSYPLFICKRPQVLYRAARTT